MLSDFALKAGGIWLSETNLYLLEKNYSLKENFALLDVTSVTLTNTFYAWTIELSTKQGKKVGVT